MNHLGDQRRSRGVFRGEVLQQAAQDPTAESILGDLHGADAPDLCNDEAGHLCRKHLNYSLDDEVGVGRPNGLFHMTTELPRERCSDLRGHKGQGLLHQAAARLVP